MKLGCLSSLWRGVSTASIDNAIACLVDLELPCIELTAEGFGRMRHLGADFTMEEAKAVGEKCRSRGLEITSISAHFPLTCPDEAMRAKAFAEYRAAIDQASAIGVKIVHGYSGGLYRPIESDAEEDKVWSTFRDNILQVLDYAAEREIRFAIEPVVSLLVHDVASTRRMFEVVNRDDLWLNFDPSHFLRSGGMDEVIGAIKEFGSRIVHVHAHDSVGSGTFDWVKFRESTVFDWRADFRPVFLGEVDWASTVGALRHVGYDGVLSYEYPVGYQPEYEYYLWAALKLFKETMGVLIAT